MGKAGETDRATQVLEILWIRYLRDVDEVAPAATEQRSMVEGGEVTIVILLFVVRQVFGDRGAFAVAEEIAKLGTNLQTAIGQQARRNRGIVVFSDIPVVRHAELVAASSGAADLRGEYAGFPGVRDREAHVGRPKDRNALEAKLHVAGRTDARI